MEHFLEYFFEHYSFTSAADYLGLLLKAMGEQGDAASAKRTRPRPRLWNPDWINSPTPSSPSSPTTADNSQRLPISVVVPCFNEELILPYLANTLKSVEAKLAKDYAPTFILVDDGSKDGTWDGMQRIFGGRPGFELYRHAANQGVAAAIMTGIRRSRTEIVCSMDCDCTYDPHELANMIPLLERGVDLVTASPYHPEGQVRNVPGWRLKLSKSASWLYRRVLRQKLHTYTSCFRIYRRSAIVNLEITKQGYLGIAEMLGLLDLQGSKVVEFPATLEVRMLGRSKMKTLRTIIGHLRLMATLLNIRMRQLRIHTDEQRPASDSPLPLPAVQPTSEPVAAVR
jgi:glycosyltransferase involved in cell wall biosynthesis